MELIRDEKDKKIYADEGTKLYTMINMGEYIGHSSREWYEDAPEAWRLMFYDEMLKDGKKKHIEALVDELGDYTRIIVELNGSKRILQLSGNWVVSDSVVTNLSDDDILGDFYTAVNNDSIQRRPRLAEHLSTKQTFTRDGETYTGDVVDNGLVLNFLQKNKELVKEMEVKGKKM